MFLLAIGVSRSAPGATRSFQSINWCDGECVWRKSREIMIVHFETDESEKNEQN